jgi:hypothetical protein
VQRQDLPQQQVLVPTEVRLLCANNAEAQDTEHVASCGDCS